VTHLFTRGLALRTVARTALFLVLTSSGSAQQRDTSQRAADTLRRRKAERPFVRGGVYDKPYQTRLVVRTAIGGYAEAHARYERVDGVRDGSGVQARRMTLFAYNEVSDCVRFAVELEFENGAEEIGSSSRQSICEFTRRSRYEAA